MTQLVTQAGAWSNGEVAYLAWSIGKKKLPTDCVGFMITRVHETGEDANKRRILPSWVAFADQDNPDWKPQDTSVWPVQRFDWRDLTLRKGRDANGMRPINFRVHYEVVPVGTEDRGGRTLVPSSPTAVQMARDGSPNYLGKPRSLYQIGEPAETNSIDASHTFQGSVKAAFNNGVLSTQNMFKLLQNAKHPLRPLPYSALSADPTTRARAGRSVEQDALKILKEEIADPTSKVRDYLDGDLYEFLVELLGRAKKERAQVYLALYELHDAALIQVLETAVRERLAYVILSSTGSVNPNKKGTPPDQRQPSVWDVENNDARARLHAAAGDEPERVADRMFATSARIGHNKFAVLVKDGRPRAVMTGSTNWTSNGLCAQSNNSLIVENADLAGDYWDYWKGLLADRQPDREPMTQIDWQGNKLVGAVGKSAKQGQALRTANAQPPQSRKLGDAGVAQLWRSPNTPQASVPNRVDPATKQPKAPPEPPDLEYVYQLMREAKEAVFFLTFLPGVFGKNNIIGVAQELAERKDGPLVFGAISAPNALPLRDGENFDDEYFDGKKTRKLPKPAIWWPQGQDGRIVMVRAAAVRVPFGNFRPELLTAGNAIIHDKIIVIDPCDQDDCTVITGSHNLGFKASYCNDDNLLVIRGNRALAIAYAVHVIDVYDHYVMRARLEENLRNQLKKGEIHSLDEAAADPIRRTEGRLKVNSSWVKEFSKVAPKTSLDYFLSHAGNAGDNRNGEA